MAASRSIAAASGGSARSSSRCAHPAASQTKLKSFKKLFTGAPPPSTGRPSLSRKEERHMCGTVALGLLGGLVASKLLFRRRWHHRHGGPGHGFRRFRDRGAAPTSS